MARLHTPSETLLYWTYWDQPAPFAVRFLSGANRLRRQLIKGMDWLLM
jgi:hypothetical protein